MTPSDVLEKYGNKDCVIEYRTYCTVDSKRTDVLAGMAQYKNKMLISMDGDSYSLNDKLIKEEKIRDDWITVWYESRWIKG